jgi:four helix bundle protein
MQDFRELKVWEKAHSLTLEIYRVTRSFPANELYGLTSQIRRAAVSIAANISEGCGRETRPDFARFLQNAAGSASEVEYHLLLAKDLGYLSPEVCADLGDSTREIKRMLSGLIQRLKRSSAA